MAVKVFLLLPAVYLTLAAVLSVGSLRYRLPAEPALAVLAAGALRPNRSAKWKREGEGRQRTFHLES